VLSMFYDLLAQVTYITNHSGEEQESIHRELIRGLHLKQSWVENLKRLTIPDNFQNSRTAAVCHQNSLSDEKKPIALSSKSNCSEENLSTSEQSSGVNEFSHINPESENKLVEPVN